MKMKIWVILLVLLLFGGPAFAADSVYHYACKRGEDRYAVTVDPDRGIVKMQQHTPPHKLTTFRILKDMFADCGKGGWKLNDGATFCYATQGVGTLIWHGQEYDCDQADADNTNDEIIKAGVGIGWVKSSDIECDGSNNTCQLKNNYAKAV
jgi:hypothetical protein